MTNPTAPLPEETPRRANDRVQAKSGEFNLPDVRQSDLAPYVGLRYLSKLFKIMAVTMMLLLVGEVITGFMAQGASALPTLLGEISRLIVMAGLLWGVGDLALLLIDMGHDIRALRVIMARATKSLPHQTPSVDAKAP